MNKQEAIRIFEETTLCSPIGQAAFVAVEAIKKQIRRRPVKDGAFGKCCSCDYEFNSELLSEYNIKYCLNCGQALDWSDEGE